MKIDIETAGFEFTRFSEMMDIEVDTSTLDAEDLASFNKLKARIIRAIQKGSLTINDDGEAVYTPSNKKTKHSEPIIFHERTGSSLMAMDGKKKGHDVAKTYAVLAEMCKIHPGIFSSMVGIDIKVCEALFTLLMD